ncbi:MAG: ribulose-phosphate 3-epimerase [Eubacteriales bacterium]|nr:ribulose-phosphate 3-epimerase [Eubacteriales bacterium]
MNILSPSILAADFKQLGEQIQAVDRAGAQYIHIDVMDGMFVPSISFGMPVISSIRSATQKVFDVHLMIQNPERYIEEFAKCGADLITVHAEACQHLDRVIQQIHDLGRKAGVALNPATPLNVLEYVLDKVDMVLLMTVNPGFGGQKYLDSCTRKITQLRNWLNETGYDTDIEVDGGINKETIHKVLKAGANIIVAGSSVFGGDAEKNTEELLNIMKTYEA